VIRRAERFLVIRRAEGIAAPGAFCFPGGGIEPDETEAVALVREIQEELCVQVAPLRRVWQSVTPWRVQLFWWTAELDAAQEPVANPAEVAEIHWLSAAEMLDLPNLLSSNRAFLAAWAAGELEL